MFKYVIVPLMVAICAVLYSQQGDSVLSEIEIGALEDQLATCRVDLAQAQTAAKHAKTQEGIATGYASRAQALVAQMSGSQSASMVQAQGEISGLKRELERTKLKLTELLERTKPPAKVQVGKILKEKKRRQSRGIRRVSSAPQRFAEPRRYNYIWW
jgi:hypothetical protein